MKRKTSIFKRVLSFVLVVAMVLSMSSFEEFGKIVANADTTTYKLYFELPEGTKVTDWAVNAWNNVTVSGDSDHKFRPTSWKDGDQYPTLLESDIAGWGYVEVAGSIDGLQFVKLDGTEYKCWNPQIDAQKITTAYFSPAVSKWYKEAKKTNEIVAPQASDVFYIKGSLSATDWNPSSDNGLMTQSEQEPSKYSVTFTNVAAGNYEYKILQDPHVFAWDKCFGLNGANRKVTVDKLADVTFTIDKNDETKACVVTFDYKDGGDIEGFTPTDQVKLVIGDNSYDMNLYVGGLYEVPVSLSAGTYTAQVKVNGENAGDAKNVTVTEAGKVYFRFVDNVLTDSVNNAASFYTAALVGNFSGVAFENPIANWTPEDANAELDYLGGGIFARTFNFAALAADTGIQYKVAFNDSWDYDLGQDGNPGGDNVAITIPAGSTSLTIFADEVNHKLYDSVNVPKLMSRITLAGTMNGWEDSVNNSSNDFRPVSDKLYVHQVELNKGHHEYKCIFNGSQWLDGGNIALDVENNNTVVAIVYDKESAKLYDSINNTATVSVLLGMAQAPAEMKTVTNLNGTTKFTATGNKNDTVKLVYGKKSEVADNGAAALTTVDLGKIETDSVSTEEIFFGDAAVDVVYYYLINGIETLDPSNDTVTVGGAEYSNYTREEFRGRNVYIPGTFPGNSWDPASNQMEYVGNGLYKHTFENVAPQNYEYKIAFGSWAENYGVGGAQGGSNYGVTVPEEQDVTIYYQDVKTHLSVTSLNYVFVKASVKGTNVEETQLKDDGLTGIYSAKIHLNAGSYSDVKIFDNDDNSVLGVFDTFTVSTAKDVTFYYAPQFGVYYNDATEWSCDESKIKYDTKDNNYKSVYGAVATNEEVTFTIDTDENVTAVKLFVKLNETKEYDLTKVSGQNKYSTTVSFDKIGEYEYFFVVYSGSAVKVYCDDSAKDYGLGKLADLTSVVPYDLVVYKNGFKTPDWMKNAVIYQIFPDRFNNGDTSNDAAQTSARGETDYELVDWTLYPENPEQEAALTAEEYAAANGFDGDRIWNNEIYGGDFKGIVERIDYLKALGVNVIYLNPVFASISSHRYDATDYGVMDPILGGDGDFAELVEIADANDMKIVLDGVFNHVSDDSIYFDRYYKFLRSEDFDGKIGAYPYWAYVYDYMADNNATKAKAEKEAKKYFTKNYGVTDYSYTEWFEVYTSTLKDDNGNEVSDGIGLRKGQPVYGYEGWWGYDSMPVIKATNGSEYQTGSWASEIIGNSNKNNGSIAQYWLSQGSDGWRLDVANEVSDETWQNFRKSVKAMGSDNVIIGEIWDDATEYLLGDMYDSVMNYVFRGAVLSYAKGGDASDAMATLEKLRERYPEEAFYAMMNLVDSHDTTRVLSFLDDIDDDRKQKDVDSAFPTYEKTSDLAKKRQYLVAFLQFTYAGAPTVYYGDEIGMVGADDPDDRRGFEWGCGNEELVKYYAKLANIRSKYSALRTGTVTPINTNKYAILGFVRQDENDTITVLTNNSSETVDYTVTLPDELSVSEFGIAAARTYTDLISGREYIVADGATTLTVSIAPYSGSILTTNPKTITVDEDALEPAFNIAYAIKSDLSAAGLNAIIDKDTFDYDGTAKTPAVTAVSYRGLDLVADTDYTVAYENNVEAGTAYAVITGKGKYTGVAKIPFVIKKAGDNGNSGNNGNNRPSKAPNKPSTNVKPNNNAKNPKTADVNNTFVWMILLMGTAMVAVSGAKRRKRY